MTDESLPDKFVRLFKSFLPVPADRPRRRIDHLPFSLHLVTGGDTVELFPAGVLDPLAFHQRRHGSQAHDLEYVLTRREGAAREDFQAYAVLRLKEEDRLPLALPAEIEEELQKSYGTFIRLPRARTLFERQYSDDLNDEDPPEGPNRIKVPAGEKKPVGRLTVAEIVHIIRKELPPPRVIAWLEGAFRQPPRRGTIEHRYYLDATGRVYLVRDHPHEGKALYAARTSDEAPKPEKRRPG